MSRKQAISLILEAYDELNMVIDHLDLLNLGLEQADFCTQEKFNRLSLLTDIYRTHAECHLKKINSALDQLIELSID
jgi:hypothetical protein